MIYLDNAATTRTAPEVVEAMLPYFTEYYGNAGSIYGLAGESRKALLRARETIAGTLGPRRMRSILRRAGRSRITGR